MRLNPFNTKRQVMRQPWRQQPHKPILVRLFSSNINFKGVYLQQDIITRPSIVSVHYYPPQKHLRCKKGAPKKLQVPGTQCKKTKRKQLS